MLALDSGKALRQHFGEAATKLFLLVSPAVRNVSRPLDSSGDARHGSDDLAASGNGNAAGGRYRLQRTFRTPARQYFTAAASGNKRRRDQIPAVERGGSRSPESGRKAIPLFLLF